MAENVNQDQQDTQAGANDQSQPEELSLARDRIKKYEGTVFYPYLDSEGNITIGTGFNVDNKDDFLALPLIYQDEKAGIKAHFATKEEKEAAYTTIKAATAGMLAEDYAKTTKVFIPEAYNDKRLDDEILKKRDLVLQHIPLEPYLRLNIPTRAAIIDAAYNSKKFYKYVKLFAAAKAADYQTIAMEIISRIGLAKESDNDFHYTRGRGRFCDVKGYGPNKCDLAFEGFLNNQTYFKRPTDKDREDAGAYVPPPGVEGDESEFTEIEKKLYSVDPSSQPAQQQPVPPAAPARPGAAAQPQQPPQQPEDERVRPGRNQPPNPGQVPQAGPAPRPGQTPPGQTPPGQPHPGQPVQGPGQGLDRAPGQRPAQGPVPPVGAPVPPPPARGPGRSDERGSLSPEDGFGKLADIPANDVASKDDRDGRGSPLRMEDYERILGHDVFRDEVAAHMAEPNPEDDGPADKRMQFGINMSLIAHGRMPKYVNGEPAVMAPLRHDIEGKPIKETLAKTSQNFAAMADRIGVIPAVKVTQGALNDLRGPAEPIKEDGEFGPISKETMRDRLFRHGYDKVRLQMQQRYQAMRRQGEERR